MNGYKVRIERTVCNSEFKERYKEPQQGTNGELRSRSFGI